MHRCNVPLYRREELLLAKLLDLKQQLSAQRQCNSDLQQQHEHQLQQLQQQQGLQLQRVTEVYAAQVQLIQTELSRLRSQSHHEHQHHHQQQQQQHLQLLQPQVQVVGCAGGVSAPGYAVLSSGGCVPLLPVDVLGGLAVAGPAAIATHPLVHQQQHIQGQQQQQNASMSFTHPSSSILFQQSEQQQEHFQIQQPGIIPFAPALRSSCEHLVVAAPFVPASAVGDRGAWSGSTGWPGAGAALTGSSLQAGQELQGTSQLQQVHQLNHIANSQDKQLASQQALLNRQQVSQQQEQHVHGGSGSSNQQLQQQQQGGGDLPTMVRTLVGQLQHAREVMNAKSPRKAGSKPTGAGAASPGLGVSSTMPEGPLPAAAAGGTLHATAVGRIPLGAAPVAAVEAAGVSEAVGATARAVAWGPAAAAVGAETGAAEEAEGPELGEVLQLAEQLELEQQLKLLEKKQKKLSAKHSAAKARQQQLQQAAKSGSAAAGEVRGSIQLGYSYRVLEMRVSLHIASPVLL